MEQQIIYIPTNYTDAGKIFGIFEIRNVVEGIILCVPTLILLLLFSPFGLTGTIILCTIVVIPLGGFAFIGVQDYSLFTFIKIYWRYKKNKRILTYRGIKWLNEK